MLNPWEMGLVGLIAVMLFGTRRLPELGSGLGQAISNFKKAYKDGTAIDVTPAAPNNAEEKPPVVTTAADDESKK